MAFTIGVEFNMDKFSALDPAVLDHNSWVKLACQNSLAKHCDPYVPMQEGVLAQSTIITEDGVTYTQPYAHYQYVGEVYGPSWPIIQDGIIVGWRSPAGKGSKHPTGRPISYKHEKHPLATSHWDKAMIQNDRDSFCQEIARILIRGALNG